MNKRIIFSLLIIFSYSVSILAQVKFTADLNNKGIQISPTHYGIFFEDINHAADGGLYAELISNRSFEDASTPVNWSTFNQTGTSAVAVIETTGLLNSAQTQALKLTITGATANDRAGIYNTGFWGINIVKGETYKVSFFAKCDAGFTGSVMASLESSAFGKFAIDTISGLTTEWKKFTCTLSPKASISSGRFVLSTNSNGTVWFDVVSVFPPTYNNHENGTRPDLTQLLADMHPKFMRFPGGCFVEGDYLANRFQWKKSIGNIEDRPGHYNLWGYRTSDGMGFYEFLQLSEDIGAKPLFVVNVGVAHNDFQPYTALDGYIQDALDALEYANGAVTTTYGAMRAASGHPAPFNIQYLEIGNENSWGDNYNNRFTLFYNAIKAKYPDIQCIADGQVTTTDYVDEHYYSSPQWFVDQYNKYDSYSRSTNKIYVGEYAVTSNCGNGNLNAAIGEAVYMCGMEKNSDVVSMNSYAPIFVNTNNRAWNPDMICYNSSSVYCTPSYYVQKMFASNIGTVAIAVKDTLNAIYKPFDANGNIGLGTWATQADYSDVKVTDSKGAVVISEPFSSTSNWVPGTGTWSLTGNLYSQTSSLTDCRSIAQTQISDSVYTYSLKARKTGGNEGFLIIFGYKDSNDFYWWNIGGWGNTQHAIEHCVGGSKTILVPVAGSISTNVWYDIRIEVSRTKVLCYLNNELIHTLPLASAKMLYTSATLDESSNQLFMKVVNPNNFSVNSTLLLKNIAKGMIPVEQTVLTSDSVSDENSYSTPLNVIPQVSAFSASDSIVSSFKANSINIIKLDLSGLLATPKVESQESSLKLSPNPCKNIVTIFGDTNSSFPLKIKDLNGRTIITKIVSGNQELDISGLASGIYIVSAIRENNVESAKLIVQ